MIDLHCHVLPGIDDGPPDWDETLRQARAGWEDGIRTVVATPHLFWGGRVNRYPEVRSLATEVELFLKEHNVPLRIIPGTEVPTLPQTLHVLGEGPLPTLGASRTVLLEPPFAGVPPEMPAFVERLLGAGYLLLLAHPERCRSLQEDPGLLRAFYPPELPIQITGQSLLGELGPLVRETALAFLACGNPVVIASDSHESFRRKPSIRRAAGVAAEVVGPEYARQMVTDLPLAILEDRPTWPPEL